ncbi:unnamed protein product [Phytophthora lilii]|uniref:Unnamed protein product n=1 Tax=Phytophthora lilii TaxID=2077276 RepID=A0A9W6TQR9_9STRA|nr:unnamed protein product [Phytophthora lilii]
MNISDLLNAASGVELDSNFSEPSAAALVEALVDLPPLLDDLSGDFEQLDITMPIVETQQVSDEANSPLHTQPVSPTLLVNDPDARIVGNRATHHTIEIPPPPQATYPSEKARLGKSKEGHHPGGPFQEKAELSTSYSTRKRLWCHFSW